jgi:hypothetical protein
MCSISFVLDKLISFLALLSFVCSILKIQDLCVHVEVLVRLDQLLTRLSQFQDDDIRMFQGGRNFYFPLFMEQPSLG